MLGGTLRQGAVQWFIVKKTEIETVDQFFLELGHEFIPADLQERLRDQLGELSQGQSRGLDDYVSRFRHVITQVQEMSELDKITYFVRGLAPAIRTERWTMTVRIIALRMEVGPTQNLVRRKWTMSESWVVKSVCVSAFASIAIDLDIHRASECRAPRQQRQASTPQTTRNSRYQRPTQRARRSSPMVEHNLAAVDEVDYPIVFDNAELNAVGIARKSNLFVVNGRVDGNDVRILIDSGASANLIQRGLVKKVLNTAVIEAQGFDGRRTKKQVNEVEASCQVQDKKFEAMKFMEWDLPNSHDVIFGQPWFVKHNPIIDWRKQTFALPEDTSVHERSGSEICSKIKNAEYEELFVVKVSAVNDISLVVPPELKPVIDRFADCFPELLPDGLPPERAVNFELQPKPDAVPSSRPPFRLSKTEQDALEEFVRDNVKKGWIEVSNSPWISNIFGVPKKDPATGMAVKRAEWLRSGNTKVPIRWVIDCRYVNSQTKIPKIPLPHIEELFDQMLGATVFTVIDIAQGYHQMRVKPDSRPYTAFRSQKETYQWCVAPMGLAGMPGVWSRLMRVLFGKFKFVVVYLDDICIFSRSMKDHAQHLAMVCEVLRYEKLYARLSKCEFGMSSVHFLGHTVTAEGIQVDAKKTTAIEKYPTPTTQKTLLSFLGLAGYYRRFICDFARIALPLHRLIKKDAKWAWSSEHDHAFRALKLALQQAPTLRLPDFDWRFTVTTDASGYCMGSVLSQKIDGFDAPIAFYSKKFGQYEEKWPAHEKELLAIKFALSKWRHYLHGRQFDVFTDNSACRWMLHHPKVTPKLARMLAFFSQLDFVLHHVKGSTNVVADALSRPGPEEVKQYDELPVVSTPEVHACDDTCHARSQSISRHVVSAAFLRHLPDSDCSVFLSAADFRGERRAVAVRQEQVHTVDTQWASVHLSEATKKAFQAGYSRDPSFAKVWQSREGNDKFEKRNGLLFLRTKHPSIAIVCPKLEQVDHDVFKSFMTSSGCSSRADAEGTAKVLFGQLFVPTVAESHHRGPRIQSSHRLLESLPKLMGIKLSMTTSHRAQADGQTERQNLVLEDALRCMVSYHGDDWVSHLGTIEFAHATLVNESTKFTPFEVDTGRKVRNLIAQEFGVDDGIIEQVDVAEFAKNFAEKRQQVIKLAQENLKQAQERQKKYYDRKRREVEFEAGDLVMLDTKNLPLKTVARSTSLQKAKLAAKKVGPFKIETMVNKNVARLVLPPNMKRLHPAFNVELLSHYVENPTKFYTRPIPKAAPVILDDETGEALHVVEALLRRKTHNRQMMWLVKWLGYPVHESTWEYEKNIRHVSHWHRILQEFEDSQREVKSGGCHVCLTSHARHARRIGMCLTAHVPCVRSVKACVTRHLLLRSTPAFSDFRPIKFRISDFRPISVQKTPNLYRSQRGHAEFVPPPSGGCSGGGSVIGRNSENSWLLKDGTLALDWFLLESWGLVLRTYDHDDHSAALSSILRTRRALVQRWLRFRAQRVENHRRRDQSALETAHAAPGQVMDLIEIPQHDLIVSCDLHHAILLWDIHDCRARGSLVGHARGVKQLVYSSHHDLLLSAGFEFDAYGWDLASRQVVIRLTGHRAPLVDVQIALFQTECAVTADCMGVFKVWDIPRSSGMTGGAALASSRGHGLASQVIQLDREDRNTAPVPNSSCLGKLFDAENIGRWPWQFTKDDSQRQAERDQLVRSLIRDIELTPLEKALKRRQTLYQEHVARASQNSLCRPARSNCQCRHHTQSALCGQALLTLYGYCQSATRPSETICLGLKEWASSTYITPLDAIPRRPLQLRDNMWTTGAALCASLHSRPYDPRERDNVRFGFYEHFKSTIVQTQWDGDVFQIDLSSKMSDRLPGIIAEGRKLRGTFCAEWLSYMTSTADGWLLDSNGSPYKLAHTSLSVGTAQLGDILRWEWIRPGLLSSPAATNVRRLYNGQRHYNHEWHLHTSEATLTHVDTTLVKATHTIHSAMDCDVMATRNLNRQKVSFHAHPRFTRIVQLWGGNGRHNTTRSLYRQQVAATRTQIGKVVQSSVQHLFWECPKAKLVWNYFYALWAKIGITPGHDPAIWIFSLDLPHTPRQAWTTIKRHIIGYKCSNEHLQDHLHPVAHMLWRYMSASLIQTIWCAHLRRMDSDPIESTAEIAIMMTRLEAGMRNLTRLAEAQAGDSDDHTVAAVLKAYVDCFLNQTDAIPLTPNDTRGVYLLFFDGGSRGNPGPGGTGSIIVRVHKDLHTASLIWAASMAYSRKDTTNNFAEYWGLIHGLREAQRSHFEPLYVVGDSALIVSQQRMHRSPRQHRLARLYLTSRRLADCIDIRGWYHHYRAFNKMADSAANLVMDTRTSTQVHSPTQRAAFNNLTQDLDNDVMHWLMRSSEDPRSLDNTMQPHIGPREHAILVKDYLAFRSDLLQSAL
ncbi:Retroelement pol polyprotein, partial [Globisporangium splendens]